MRLIARGYAYKEVAARAVHLDQDRRDPRVQRAAQAPALLAPRADPLGHRPPAALRRGAGPVLAVLLRGRADRVHVARRRAGAAAPARASRRARRPPRPPAPTRTPTTAPTAPRPPPRLDTWTVGARPLPLRPDGFGQVLRTPAGAAGTTAADRRPAAAAAGRPVPRDRRPGHRAGPRRMGETWSPSCPVRLDGLRHLTLSFHGLDGAPHTGELVVNAVGGPRAWCGVFRRLWRRRVPDRGDAAGHHRGPRRPAHRRREQHRGVRLPDHPREQRRCPRTPTGSRST